ncbi:MAG: hypothetical protein AAFR93_09510 [Pseudomonadota bacterium]
MRGVHPNTVLGLLCVAFGAGLFLLWIPMDTGSAYLVKQRGQLSLGDALAPGFAASLLALSGLLLLLGPKAADVKRLTTGHLRFLGVVLALVVASLLVMRWAGPLLASILAEEDYRVLRDTAPWKHIGFVAGGSLLVSGLIAVVERGWTWRAAAIGLGAALAIIALYDLPFDDLLLPPNGDV